MKDNDNSLQSNINAINPQSQPVLVSDQKSRNALDDTITASKKRGSKILELKKVSDSFNQNQGKILYNFLRFPMLNFHCDI